MHIYLNITFDYFRIEGGPELVELSWQLLYVTQDWVEGYLWFYLVDGLELDCVHCLLMFVVWALGWGADFILLVAVFEELDDIGVYLSVVVGRNVAVEVIVVRDLGTAELGSVLLGWLSP